MDVEVNVTATEQLRAAGTNPSKQVPALVKLGEWYLKKAKTTSNAADFTKANALYNAALVRSRSTHHEINEDQILQRIVETYCEFLRTFTDNDEKLDADKIWDEIDFHKKFLVNERESFKNRFCEIDSFLSKNDKTKDEHQIYAKKIHELFRDIQDMYIRLVSMLVKECESKLGLPPCSYAIIALGSVARIEATPFSDLEFAILHSDQALGEKIKYFQVLTHFLHVKVINLGETILPALGIKELNDFQSIDPNGSWFYDTETPRGISFDGAMPWASKTPLGRMEMKNKPALELIRTPEQMAKFQDEEVALKEGYHLADIMARTALLYGDEALLNEYNERVNEKLNAKSSEMEGKCIKTVGAIRGMQQMKLDIETYDPFGSHMGIINNAVGACFNVKNQFYRLISLLLSNLGMIFDIKCSSPWQIISELLTRRIISESQSLVMKECLSFANEIRLRTYFANNGQKEFFSSLPHYAKPTDSAVFQDVEQHNLVHFLNTSYDIHRRCKQFIKGVSQDKIDFSIFHEASALFSNAMLFGFFYYRLQNFHAALKWVKSESKDSPYYVHCVVVQGHINVELGEYDKGIKCFEEALHLGYQNKPDADVFKLSVGLATALFKVGKYKMSIDRLNEAIYKHEEIFREKCQKDYLIILMGTLASTYHYLGDLNSAVKHFEEAQAIQEELTNVPDMFVAFLNINMAITLGELDRYAESIECMQRGLQLSQKVFGENNLSIILAEAYSYAGRVYGRCSRKDEAVCWFKRSLELYYRIVGDDPHPGKLEALIDFGGLLVQRHQTEKAIENFEIALKLARAINDKKLYITLPTILSNIGAALAGSGKFNKSVPYFVEAKEVMDKLLGPNHLHPLTSSILLNLALSQRDLGNLPEALRCFNDAFQMNCKLHGENDNCDGMEAFLFEIAVTLTAMARYEEAMKYCTKAIKILQKIPLTKKKCWNSMKIFHLLARICLIFGRQNEALKYLEEARKIAKDTGCKDWVVVGVLVELIKGYAKMACIPESLLCYLEAREMAKSLPKEHSLPDMILDMLKLMKT